MNAMERRQRWIRTTGGSLTAITLYLLLCFTGLCGRDLTHGVEGLYASAGETSAVALESVDQALRGGTPLMPAPAASPDIPTPTALAAVPAPAAIDAAARTPVTDGTLLLS